MKVGLRPRPYQLEVTKGVLTSLESGLNTLLVAPTGFGKTLAVLAALKASRRLPALWLVRSLQVSKRVVEDAALIGLKPFAAAGRERTCPLAGVLGSAVHAWCRVNRAKCEYYLELLKRGVEELLPMYWHDLLGGSVCPYYAQDLYARRADIVVQSYYRRPYPVAAVVVDEAHNLLAPRERRLGAHSISAAIAELKALGRSDIADEVAGVSRTVGHVPFERLPLAELEQALIEAVSKLKEVKGLPKLVAAIRTCQLGGTAYREPWEDYVAVYEPPFRPRIEPAIYLTATLPEGLEEALNVQAVIRVPSARRTAFVTSWLTTKFGEETWSGYAKLLTYLRFKYRRVLAFATERVAMHLLDSVQLYEPELSEPPKDWEGVMLLHVRGRFAEGVDLPADAVVILGAPFLPPEVTSRLRKYYERLGAGDAALWAPMVIATLQAIGRAARSPEQRPVMILADERFLKYRDKLRPYLEVREIENEKALPERRRHAYKVQESSSTDGEEGT